MLWRVANRPCSLAARWFALGVAEVRCRSPQSRPHLVLTSLLESIYFQATCHRQFTFKQPAIDNLHECCCCYLKQFVFVGLFVVILCSSTYTATVGLPYCTASGRPNKSRSLLAMYDSKIRKPHKMKQRRARGFVERVVSLLIRFLT